MRLSEEQSHALLERYGASLTEVCDKCGKILGHVRFTRYGEQGEWCARLCRDGVTCRRYCELNHFESRRLSWISASSYLCQVLRSPLLGNWLSHSDNPVSPAIAFRSPSISRKSPLGLRKSASTLVIGQPRPRITSTATHVSHDRIAYRCTECSRDMKTRYSSGFREVLQARNNFPSGAKL